MRRAQCAAHGGDQLPMRAQNADLCETKQVTIELFQWEREEDEQPVYSKMGQNVLNASSQNTPGSAVSS